VGLIQGLKHHILIWFA